MKLHPIVLLPFAAVLSAGAATAPTPATAPDRSTPQKSLTVWLDGIETEDLAAVRGTFQATTASSRAMADDLSQVMVYCRRFRRVMKKYFPDKEPLISDIAGDESVKQLRDMLAKTTFTIDGNRATATPPDVLAGTMGGRLVYDGKSWLINLDRVTNVENYLNDKAGTGMGMFRMIGLAAPVLNDMATDIEAGKLKTYEEAKQTYAQRSSVIYEKMSRDFNDMRAAADQELSTPQKTLLTFHRAIRDENLEAARAALLYSDDHAIAFAKDHTLVLVTWHRYERIMKAKFPNNSDVLVWEMFSDRDLQFNMDAIAKATFAIDGDHAKITTSPGLAKGDLILSANTWRLDLDHLAEAKSYPPTDSKDGSDNPIYLLARTAPALDAAVDGVEAGKFTTAAQVVDFVKKESAALRAKLPPVPPPALEVRIEISPQKK